MSPWKITQLNITPPYSLNITFADGTTGTVDMANESFIGMFAPLQNPAYFALATLQNGVVTWPNGLDIAPDAMYEEVLACGLTI